MTACLTTHSTSSARFAVRTVTEVLLSMLLSLKPPCHMRLGFRLNERFGGVPERSNGAVLKTVGRASVPWVRIPPPPLNQSVFRSTMLVAGYHVTEQAPRRLMRPMGRVCE